MEKKPKYRLKYFASIRGRAEVMALMFRLAKVEYEDVRIDAASWPGVKPTLPLGQLPVLEQEGQPITVAQSVPIAMYLAEELGFLPEEKWKVLLTNSIAATLNDLTSTFGAKRYAFTVYKFAPSPGEEELAKATEECVTAAKQALDYIEKLADKNTKFIFSDQIQLADLFLYMSLEYCCVEHPELREYSDWLKQWIKNFESDPRIAEYLQTRPTTMFGT